MSWIGRLKRWLKSQVQEVPDSLAVCEFGCRETECRQGYWETCERRIGYMETSHQWQSRVEGSQTVAVEERPAPSLAERNHSTAD